MGIFDLSIQKDIKRTDNILEVLDKELSPNSKQSALIEKNSMKLEKFRTPNSVLKYNLDIDVKNRSLTIEGELQNVWVLVIVIIFSILYTQGIGVILVVDFVYLHKMFATKYIESSLNNLAIK